VKASQSFNGLISGRRIKRAGLLVGIAAALTPALYSQTGGEGGLQGTITDGSGAVVPHASVTVTNQATGIKTIRESSGTGVFTISPLPPGTYTVDVVHDGFQELVQKNITVDALVVTAFDPKLSIGQSSEVVTVTAAPPQLNTSDASLGLTIENTTYQNLPLITNNAQRDATAFGALAPGAQGGARLPIIGGTGDYLGQLYVDGLPAETVTQQGDNRLVSQALPIEAIDQFQVVTSTPPVEYSGAGSENFTVKSGGLQYHGQVSDFIRNTAFDAWAFLTKAQTVPNSLGVQVPAGKPVDHQNELSASFGGHIPFTKRVFFFVAYDRYHQRVVKGPSSLTVPTALMRTGDFTELNGGVGAGLTGVAGDPSAGGTNKPFLYDPTSTKCNGNVCTRQPFMGTKNGIPTYNVIPSSYLSPITKAMQANLPLPTNPAVLANNYTGSVPGGYDNYNIDWRFDYQVTPNQRLSTVGAMGQVNYLNNFSSPYLPLPYTGGDLASIYPKIFDVQDVLTINNSLVNQVKFGYVRFYQNIHNNTQGVSGYQIGDYGVTNLPPGQAGQSFPGVSFSGTSYTTGLFGTGLTTWTGNSDSVATQLQTPNNYTILDNLLWTKGSHSVTAGIQVQWQESNAAVPATQTANFATNSNALTSGSSTFGPSGYSYASFLLGAIGGSPSLTIRNVSETGGRYRPIAPYLSDNWKINNRLTLDAGIRWDYLPPYHEVLNRWSFLNPNVTNPATGTPGAIQFAGNYGGPGVSCECTTPVQTYWHNWGPRVGLIYAPDEKSAFRIGVGRVFSQGGGVGGRNGNYQGTGALGFNVTATAPQEVTSGATASPSFYLNPNAPFSNTALGFSYPSAPVPGAGTQSLNAGYYVSGGKNVTASSVSYADPYFSGRAPDFTFWNAGIERAITKDIILSINYVGNESHHLSNYSTSSGNIRGYWANQLDPKYLAGLGSLTDSTGTRPLLSSPATAANVQLAQKAMAGISIPAFFQADAANNSNATIAQGLVAFPQYSGVTDTWGINTGNFSYHSLQVVVRGRESHGLTFNFNYTWSKNLGDDGTFRSGFAIPQAAISGGTHDWNQDRIERSVDVINAAHVIHAFGVYKLPFGRGELGGNHLVTRQLFGGWQFSGISSFSSGVPLAIVQSGCSAPGQGQCMPDLNPNFIGSPRINGKYGSGPNGHTACNLGVGSGCTAIKYLTQNAFQLPRSISPISSLPITLLGNAPRTRAYGLVGPVSVSFDAALRRTFVIHDSINFQFEATAANVLNHTNFGAPNQTSGSSSFGAVTSVSNSPRSFQFAGHLNF
jgi:hypothetical protein